LKFAILGKTGQRSEGFYSHSRNYRRVTFGELLIWAIYKKSLYRAILEIYAQSE